MNKILIVFFTLQLLTSCSTFHQSEIYRSIASEESVKNCADSVRAIVRKENDTAIEIEIGFRNKEGEFTDTRDIILNSITTTDGTIGPLLSRTWYFKTKAPEWLVNFHKNSHLSSYKLKEIPFSELTLDQRHELLKFLSTSKRKNDFFSDRKIHGIKFKDELEFTFDQETEFLGEVYEPGTHLISIKGVLRDIEYMSPKHVEDVSGIEIHFRTNLKAGNVSNDAWTFLEGLKMSKFSQHAHIVSKIDLEKLKQSKEIQVAKHAEFYRRVNLLAEMVEVFTNRRRLFMKIDEDDKNVTNFGTTTSDKISGIFEYFLNVSNGSKPQIGDKFKMGYVGMRGSDKYDSPGLWGLEYRALSRNGQRSIYMTILNKIQELMDNGNMGISDNEMSDWFDFKNLDSTKKIKNAISNSYYRKKKVSPDGYHNEKLNQILGELKPDQLKQLNELAEENLSIMMIFHNWDEDILVYNNPEVLEKIYKAQMRAAHKIVKLMKKTKEDERKKETVNAVQMFLKDSRLITLFAEPFELQDLDLRMKQ